MIRIWKGLAAVLVVGLGVLAAFNATTSAGGALESKPAQNAATSSEERAVADWSLIAQNTIVAVGRRFPGEAAVLMGIVHAAIYDAVVAIEGGYRPYAITPTVPPDTSVEAAVATAAHRVLVGRFGDQQAGLDDLYLAYLNAIPDTEAKTNGVRLARKSAPGCSCSGPTTGSIAACPTSSGHPAQESTNRPHPVPPLGTRMPHVLPLALDNASQFRPGGPPALHSGDYARRLQRGEGPGASRQQRAERGADRRGAVLDRPRSSSVESQPAAARRRARPDLDRDGADAGHGSRGRRRRHDRLLRRQVSLPVLAPRSCDPTRRYGWQRPHVARSGVAALVADAESSGVSVSACLSHDGHRRSTGGLLRSRSPPLLGRQPGDR